MPGSAARPQKTADLLLAYGRAANAMCRARTRRALPGARAFATHDALVAALEETCRAGDTLLFKGTTACIWSRCLHAF